MTTRMLINAQRAEQLRVAIVDGTNLEDYQVEIAEAGLTRGNIYRGVVAAVQPSLNAAFVDIGEERNGFLQLDDVQPKAYHRRPPEGERPRIDQVLERGKPVVVQVTRDGIGQKGPALSTNATLAGRYLVLNPFDATRGISRKAEDDEARKKIRERLNKLTMPEGCGVIVRTNGLEQNQTTLNRDLNALMRLWNKVRDEAGRGKGPRLLYSDQDLVVQALRDYLDNSIEQVIVDDDEVYARAESFMHAFMPRSRTKLIRYGERQPLFSRYALERQIDRIYERTAPLPGGGSIVIDVTEALTAIDVNSGRSKGGSDHEESIFKVNVEAANEVARQLRLRDIGGLVVIDFIDMRVRKHQRNFEKVMRDAMKVDKARHTIGRISPNGLVEINRQRIRQALHVRTHRPCPTCQGAGTIPSADFAAAHLLGRIEARATTGLIESVLIALNPELADALQNAHRAELAGLEQEFGIRIEIIAAPNLTRSEERIEWVQREGSAAAAAPRKTGPVLTATDLAAPAERGRRRGAQPQDERPAEAGEETGEERPRKRRRRRRKTSSSDAGSGEETNAAAESGDAPAAKAAAARDQPGATEDDEEAPAKPRRRRRSSRRSKKSGDEDAKEQAATAEPSPSPPSASEKSDSGTIETRGPDEDGDTGDEETPSRSRRRRRTPRRRRKPAGEKPAGEEPAGEEPAGEEVTEADTWNRPTGTESPPPLFSPPFADSPPPPPEPEPRPPAPAMESADRDQGATPHLSPSGGTPHLSPSGGTRSEPTLSPAPDGEGERQPERPQPRWQWWRRSEDEPPSES
ncbi:MAG: Rne/Rng family ribonuclease [bacterium]|nr:Rne/Rng family ribonuclease [bacterium]